MDINAILQSLVQPLPPAAGVSVPPLGFSVPTDLDAKFKEFLDRASKDPDIVTYYQGLLDMYKGDTELAKSQIEHDYQTGVRQTTDTLKNSLQQLGITFTGEQNTEKDTLNKRGIAITDTGDGKTAYAAGGQPATELSQLNDSQKLRSEAEQRTASQKIENMGITRSKNLTNAGQTLRNEAIGVGEQQKQDVYNRANTNFGAFQAQQTSNAQQASNNQSSSGSSTTADRGWINPKTNIWDDNYHATGNTG